MTASAKEIIEKLKGQNIECACQEAVDGGDLLSIWFAGSKPDVKYEILIVIDRTERNVIVRTYNVMEVEKSKKKNMLRAMNHLNMNCRWIKFYIDEDSTVAAGVDAITTPETCAEISYALLVRTLQIVDGCYEELAEALN